MGKSDKPAACAIEHRRGAIDTDQADARPYERYGNAARPAAKFEDGATGLHRYPAPERHVAPAERPCVLPVVERRVVVPTFPALSLHHRDDVNRSTFFV